MSSTADKAVFPERMIYYIARQRHGFCLACDYEIIAGSDPGFSIFSYLIHVAEGVHGIVQTSEVFPPDEFVLFRVKYLKIRIHSSPFQPKRRLIPEFHTQIVKRICDILLTFRPDQYPVFGPPDKIFPMKSVLTALIFPAPLFYTNVAIKIIFLSQQITVFVVCRIIYSQDSVNLLWSFCLTSTPKCIPHSSDIMYRSLSTARSIKYESFPIYDRPVHDI